MADAVLLPEYYRRLDGVAPGDPLELVGDQFEFEIIRPDSGLSGGRAEFVAYITARHVPERRHRVIHAVAGAGIEFVIGEVHERGVSSGMYIASAQVGADGRLCRYFAARLRTLSLRPAGPTELTPAGPTPPGASELSSRA